MKTFLAVLCGLTFAATTALAQAPPETHASNSDSDSEMTVADSDSERKIRDAERTGTLPRSQSDTDSRPPAPSPAPPPGGLVEQAGIGGVVSYARVGVLELGGELSLDVAKDYFRFSIAPSIGYFIVDNIRLSAMLGLSYAEIANESQTLFSFLVEPSVHIPFSDAFFGFLGVGMGVAYADAVGAGFALKPRLGVNILVGRSGILSPAMYVEYTTTSALQTSQGTLLQVSFGYGLSMGYTVMW